MTSDFLAQASSTGNSRVENINVKTQQCTLHTSFFTIDNDSGNPHHNIPVTKPVREAKARLWVVAPLMMMMNDSGGLNFDFCVEKRATVYIVCYFNINLQPVNRAMVGNECETTMCTVRYYMLG
jgi:hypothetical protein